MKNLKSIVVATALLVGLGASSASADCCTPCCTPVKCVKTITKCVPYKVWVTKCVPVYDASGNLCGYKEVKTCVTKYKTVTEKVTVDCCCCQ